MPTVDFPASPALNDTYTVNGRTWQYNGTGWAVVAGALSILDADVNASAGIAYSKLNLLGAIVNADVNASAAIAGTKINPNFGSQAGTTTGTWTAGSFIPTSSSAPANGMYLSAAGILGFSANSVARMFLRGTDGTNTGILGIGNGTGIGTPAYPLDIRVNNGTWEVIRLEQQASNVGALIRFKHANAPANGWDLGLTAGADEFHIRRDGSALNHKVLNNGNVHLGNSTSNLPGFNNTTQGFCFESSSGAIFVSRGSSGPAISANLNTDGTLFSARRSGNEVGTITVNSSVTAYNTSSDYRLKENVVSLTSAISRLLQIPVHRFNFIVSPERTVDGFLAHEVSPVVPEAVTGEHNAVDADGNPVYQQIDQSKLVPLLTAALQEAVERIETLEAQVAALTP